MLVLNSTPFVHARGYLQYLNCALPGITNHFRGMYGIYPNLIKENWRMRTCNQLDLQILGSQPVKLCPKISWITGPATTRLTPLKSQFLVFILRLTKYRYLSTGLLETGGEKKKKKKERKRKEKKRSEAQTYRRLFGSTFMFSNFLPIRFTQTKLVLH